MRKILSLSKFAKKLGFKSSRDKEFRARLRFWQEQGVIEIQQSGFIADSMHHHKIVVIRGELRSELAWKKDDFVEALQNEKVRKRVGKKVIKRIVVEVKEIEGCFPAPITMRGNSYYVRLDPHFVKFWELQAGDEILVTVTKAKRETKWEENQE